MLLGSRYIHVNSKNRDNGTITRFTCNFPSNMFNIDFTRFYLKMSLEEINIKYSWYNITETNSRFAFNKNGVNTFLHLEEGNYNIDTVLIALRSVLSGTYTIAYNSIQNKFVFTALDPLYSFTCISMGWMLGLTDGVEYVGSFKSEFPVSMQYTDILYLNCNMPRINDSVDNINSLRFSQSTIIATIPITARPMDNIHYKPNLNTGDGIFLALKNFDSFEFWITTNKGEIVLNHDFTFTLKLEQYPYYRKFLK